MKKLLNQVISIFLSVVLMIGTTVLGVSASTDNYKENFINELLKNQSFWDYNNYYKNYNNYKFYFCDIDMNGDLELVCEREFGLNEDVWSEVIGFSDGELFKYRIGNTNVNDMGISIMDNFSLYYDTNSHKYRWFNLKSNGGIHCDIKSTHECYSNYEVAVYDEKIYKDYFTAYCSENGYYELFRKGDIELGYIPGSYSYNISGPDNEKEFYDRVNEERFNGLIEAIVSKKYVSFYDFRDYSSSEKRKALEEAYDGFKYGYTTQEPTTQVIDEQVDYSKYNPMNFIGKSFDEITNIFGNDYTEIEERESGLTKFIGYPNTGNPFEFGFDHDTNFVKYIYIYNLTDKPIKLFDDITNKSTLGDIEKSTTSYTYSKWVGENIFNDNNIEQNVTYKINNGIIVGFEWTSNDFNKQSANRVLVMREEVEETTNIETTSIQDTTQASINPTVSTDATSKISTSDIATSDTATKDSVNNDNGTIQTGAISIAVIIFLILVSLATGSFAWYRRKIK